MRGPAVAWVTGAGQGIGRAVALGLAEAGHPVVLTARTEDALESVAHEIAAAGGRAVALPGDVTVAQQMNNVAAEAAQHVGEPLIVVNNAGAASSHKFRDHPDSLWSEMLAVNLTGAFHVTRAAAGGMLDAGWGRVVNIGSVASLTGAPYIAAYTAAKHGLLGLTRALAAEWVRSGITVNLVAPGYVDTAMTEATVANVARRTGRDAESARDIVTRLSPQHQLVPPEALVPLILFLISEAGAHVTGAAIPLDGGASAIAAVG